MRDGANKYKSDGNRSFSVVGKALARQARRNNMPCQMRRYRQHHYDVADRATYRWMAIFSIVTSYQRAPSSVSYHMYRVNTVDIRRFGFITRSRSAGTSTGIFGELFLLLVGV